MRDPDYILGDGTDVTTITGALKWSARIAARLAGSRRKVRSEFFGGDGGICIVHGDTPTTFLSCLLARRAGLQVAHLEAGLRSNSIFHPFPEELIRLAVMRVSNVLLRADARRGREPAPPARSRAASSRSRRTRRSRPSGTPRSTGSAPTVGPVIVTMHRVENVHRRERVLQFVDTVIGIAAERPVRFVVHGPTQHAIERLGLVPKLEAAGVEMCSLAPHGDFVGWMAEAPFVIIDGGSIQEECAYLGVPDAGLARQDRAPARCRPQRRRLPLRPGGDRRVPGRTRRRTATRPSFPELSPSEQILDVLLEMLPARAVAPPFPAASVDPHATTAVARRACARPSRVPPRHVPRRRCGHA